MKKLFTKLVACVAVVSMVATMGVAAFAQTEMSNMEFVGYDLTNKYAPNRIYNEVINGQYTNKQVLVPVEPEAIEWVAEWYEQEYPYAGYNRLYLDGKKQNITAYNNLFPQWETRRQDYFWEVKAPHVIWERQQTKVNDKDWTWDFGNEKFNIPDSVVKTRTAKEAVVVYTEMLPYGFGWYNNQGEILSLKEQAMYNAFNTAVKDEEGLVVGYKNVYDAAINEWSRLLAAELTVDKLSARELYTNLYEVTDEEIQAMIPVVYSNYITAKFNDKNNDGLATKNVAVEYLLHGTEWPDWDWNTTFEVKYDADIEWTAPAYEMEEPYRQYQYLIVNGIVLDGKDGKAEVLRYTGGKEVPVVEWKFAFFQYALDAAGEPIKPFIFEAVEQKFVDGVAAFDEDGYPVYRIPAKQFINFLDNKRPIYAFPADEMGEYTSTYCKAVGDTIEYWAIDAAGNHSILVKFENWTGTLESALNAYISGSLNYAGVVPEEEYNMLP